jgi:hypothetical protein
MLRVHRINARRQLFRQLQQFFEQHLIGLWTISDVVFDPPELLAKEPGRRQLHRESISGHFGAFTITLSSPEEKPPLGEIVCQSLHGLRIEGPLDARTWERIAAEIRPSATNGDDNERPGRHRAFS